MPEIIIGMLVALTAVLIVLYVRKNGLKVRIGGWALVAVTLLYSLFVLELIISFIKEGANQAALVMGGVFGFVAIILWVLLVRFVLTSKSQKDEK